MNALLPDPDYRKSAGDSWITDLSDKHPSQLLGTLPDAYAEGFERGAQALADHIFTEYKKSPVQAISFLYGYEQKQLCATEGWKTSPPKK